MSKLGYNLGLLWLTGIGGWLSNLGFRKCEMKYSIMLK